MKNIYISRPADSKLHNNVKIIENQILAFIKNKHLILDRNNDYQIISNFEWLDDDQYKKFSNKIKDLNMRLNKLAQSDYVIFLYEWLSDFVECKIEYYILESTGKRNYIILQFNSNKELELCDYRIDHILLNNVR